MPTRNKRRCGAWKAVGAARTTIGITRHGIGSQERRGSADEIGGAGGIPRKRSRNAGLDVLTVGIGASAGGLDAYRTFFANMPADSGMAFVLIQHLAPDHKSMLAELVARSTAMPVIEAADKMLVEPNRVFVIPPDATMTIAGGRLKIVKPAPPRELRRPIDSFLQSLAEDRGEDAVGIILSGTGSDGARGLVSIKEHGGLTLAQAEFDHEALPGMPRSAAATGQVDDVLAVEAMPERLIAYQTHLRSVASAKGGDGARTDTASHLSTIMNALRTRVGHDFGAYKEKTLVRRIQRRMQVLQIADPADYIQFYREHPEELELLFRELLIGVTEFFRDPAAFDALDETVLKPLVAARGADQDIRIWVPGCAAGQEAYSIAILLREAMDPRRQRPRVQIFGTDIDDRAIAEARIGRYRLPPAGLSPERIERWFTCEGKDCSVVPEIREMCVFSAHSLIKDPPFSRLDLISCRNLLIYLDPSLQERVMRTFHYALKPGGKLFLGSSESVTRATRLFEAEDKKHRIFARREVEQAALPDLTGGRRTPIVTPPQPRPGPSGDRVDKGARRAMEKHYPPHIVLDRDNQIVRFSGGSMGRYLEPSPGAPSFDLFSILRKPLRAAVRSALQEAKSSSASVIHDNILFRGEGGPRLVTLIAEPLSEHEGAPGCIVLAFQDGGPAGDGKAAPAGENASETLKALEQELLTTRSQLQSTIDELESANEEMKSSNEEYQSVNEELQSSNEELETSKEEMQSINEELQTINAEMVSKNRQLTRLNSDIANLLESTEIATMFLDEHLRLKSFTRGVTDIFRVRETDIGRPITEIVSALDYSDLQRDVKKVLRTLGIVEREVALNDMSMTFTLRIRPYRTVDNVISGVVMTFVDITARRAADDALRESEVRYRSLFDAIDEGFCTLEKVETRPGEPSDFRYLAANPAFAAQAGVSDVVGKTIREAFPGEAQEWFDIYDSVLRTGEATRFARPLATQDRFLELFAFPLPDSTGRRLAVIFSDVSKRHQSEETQSLLLKELDHRVKNLFAVIGGVVTLSARSAPTIKELVKTIQGRIGALASAHVLIRAENPGDTRKRKSTLGQLVRTILAPYAQFDDSGDGSRAKIEGPEVAIGGGAVTSLALLLHELATNAAKYGALSVPGGQIRVSWKLNAGQLHLIWKENGGPAIDGEPPREGFGSMLARRSVAGQLGGQLSFDWNKKGVVVHLTVPEEQLVR
jgi:two-component system CheB/CheR fusion protein